MTRPTSSSSSRLTAAAVLAALDRINHKLDKCLRLLAASPQATAQRPTRRANS